MSMQLQKIITRIEYLVDMLHNNNVAELEGCVGSLMAGIALKDNDIRSQRLDRVAHNLHKAIEANIKMLHQEVSDCPKAETGFLDAWGGDGLQEAQQKMARAQNTACALFQGIVALYYSYVLRPAPEYDVAEKVTHDLICRVLSSVDIVDAHKKNALAAGGKDSLCIPLFWHDLNIAANNFLQVVAGEKEVEIIVPHNVLIGGDL